MLSSTNEDERVKFIGKAATLPLDALVPSASNREARKDEDLRSLATSIRNVGLIYPLVVRPDSEQEGAYRIIAGERRWRAMKMLKVESAPCIVLSAKEDETTAEVLRVVENHQRRNLTPLEEAAAVRSLLDLGLEPEAVARSLGRSRSWVARRASLTELSERWLQEVNNPESRIAAWPPSHLEVISRFPAEAQDLILDEWNSTWRWSIPAFRDLVGVTSQFLRTLPENPALVIHNAEDLRKEHPNLVLLNNSEEDSSRLQEIFQADIVSVNDVAPSPNLNPRAVPALVINGPGLDCIKWVQPLN